jgi:tetratricopeptide (TPR) repeat protein
MRVNQCTYCGVAVATSGSNECSNCRLSVGRQSVVGITQLAANPGEAEQPRAVTEDALSEESSGPGPSHRSSEFLQFYNGDDEIERRVDPTALIHFVVAFERTAQAFLASRVAVGVTSRIACALLPEGNTAAGGKFIEVSLFPNVLSLDEIGELANRLAALPSPPVVEGSVTFLKQQQFAGGGGAPDELALPFAQLTRSVLARYPASTLGAALMYAGGLVSGIQPTSTDNEQPQQLPTKTWMQRFRAWLGLRGPIPTRCQPAVPTANVIGTSAIKPSVPAANVTGPAVTEPSPPSAEVDAFTLPPGELGIPELNELIAQHPGVAVLYEKRGLCHYRDGNPQLAMADFDAWVRLFPEDSRAYHVRANAHLEAGDTAAELPDLNRCLELNPELVAARKQRVRLYRNLGAWERTLADIDYLISHDPRSPEHRLARLPALCHLKRFADAWQELAEIERVDPHHPDLFRLRASLRHMTSEVVDASVAEAILADLNRCVWLQPDNIPARLMRTDIQLTLGYADRAIADCNEVLRLDPSSRLAFFQRGLAHLERAEPAAAIADLSHAIELGEHTFKVYWARCEAHAAVDDHVAAIADLDAAIALDDQQPMAWAARGHLYCRTKEFVKAIDDLTVAIRLGHGFADVFCKRGIAYLATGEVDLAFVDLSRAIELDEKMGLAYGNRGQCWAAKGRLLDALTDFNQAIRHDSSLGTSLYYARAQVLMQLDDMDAAVRDLDEFIRAVPDCADAYLHRSTAKTKLRRHDQAGSDFDKFIEISPDDARGYLGRGQWWVRRGRMDLADADFDTAVKVCPDLEATIAVLRPLLKAVALSECGAHDEAVRAATEALAIDEQCVGAYFTRAGAHWAVERFVEAIEDFTRILAIAGEESPALSSRGQVYAELGEYELALQDLDRSLERLIPATAPREYACARNGRALALAGLGRIDEAFLDITASLREFPGNAWVQYTLARIYRAQGKLRESAVCFQLALALDDPPLTTRMRQRAAACLP